MNSANPQFLRLVNVKKTYDQQTLVVKDFSLDVAEGEFITLLGPSGSGKTTVLMMLAGFESVTGGQIYVDGVSFLRKPPHKRNIGMVFQNYALFPNMTIADNLAYQLKLRSLHKSEIHKKVNDSLKMIELNDFGSRYPSQLSGGQKQRVALARALIFSPKLVLMDEPLGALDRQLREQMQLEITKIHKHLGFTVVYVTHDQVEALTMSSRIAVFNHGVVQQYATPNDLYEHPANAFVAGFIGENNLFSGTVTSISGNLAVVRLPNQQIVRAMFNEGLHEGSACTLSVRPEKLFFGPVTDETINCFKARLLSSRYVGDFVRYYFSFESDQQIVVKILSNANSVQLIDGMNCDIFCQIQDCFVFPIS
jgi:putative spermidine/putrescine transport system ATP-binding protein